MTGLESSASAPRARAGRICAGAERPRPSAPSSASEAITIDCRAMADVSSVPGRGVGSRMHATLPSVGQDSFFLGLPDLVWLPASEPAPRECEHERLPGLLRSARTPRLRLGARAG